ncbi:MAG: hypothetical protein EA360_05585 [Balneolaceae bacterium]|nr:MAG: hypothetical protein EA360_05585 [Balneolaceae bacterium]
MAAPEMNRGFKAIPVANSTKKQFPSSSYRLIYQLAIYFSQTQTARKKTITFPQNIQVIHKAVGTRPHGVTNPIFTFFKKAESCILNSIRNGVNPVFFCPVHKILLMNNAEATFSGYPQR